MATENSHYDPLRNPQVDYERADLSARGILLFLIGLFVAGVFIELVLWGMFHFMARSQVLFPRPIPNPMMAVQKPPAAPIEHSILQNTPPVDLGVFPEPRLQVADATDMREYLESEQKLLNPSQPFADPSGAIHIPISLAMTLIEERGLPVRPNPPPSEANTQTDAGNTKMLDVQAGPLGPAALNAPKTAGEQPKPSTGEQKQP